MFPEAFASFLRECSRISTVETYNGILPELPFVRSTLLTPMSINDPVFSLINAAAHGRARKESSREKQARYLQKLIVRGSMNHWVEETEML